MKAKRVGILSDTHGVLNPSVLDRLVDCDLVLHAGDIGGAGVIDTLREATGAPVVAVRGNNDVSHKWPGGEDDVLSGLEESAYVELPGGRIAMEHGHRIWDTRNYHRRLRNKYPDVRVVVYGHTHIRVVDTSESPWVVNPGAAGRERTKDGPSCLVVEAAATGWSVEQYCYR